MYSDFYSFHDEVSFYSNSIEFFFKYKGLEFNSPCDHVIVNINHDPFESCYMFSRDSYWFTDYRLVTVDKIYSFRLSNVDSSMFNSWLSHFPVKINLEDF